MKMTICGHCGEGFQVSDARSDYNAEYEGDPDYDEGYEGEVCGGCAISETSSNITSGRAIGMMNGDEDYDASFIETHL